jgi:Domain of unknown function (DUF4351)
MTDHDGLFKKLLRTFFVEFVEVFLPDVSQYLDKTSLEFLDKEVFPELDEEFSREADVVVKAKVHGKESFFLIHVENQAARRPRFNRRMFFYTAWLDKTFDLPVYPVALLTYDKPRSPEPDHYEIEFPGFEVLKFNFRTIQLNRLNWRDYLRQHNPIATALMSKMNIAPADRVKVKVEMLRLFSTMKLNREKMTIVAKMMNSYLKLTSEEQRKVRSDVKKFEPKRKKVVMEYLNIWEQAGFDKGIKQGTQQGVQIGMQKGVQLGVADTVLHLLNIRIGAIGVRTQSQIKKLPASKLRDLSAALLNFSTRTDLTTWLKDNG